MLREVEYLRGVESVKHVHQIQVEILLEPNNITFGAMEDLAWHRSATDMTRGAEVYDLINKLSSHDSEKKKPHKTLSGSSPTLAGWDIYPNGTCALNLCRKEGYHGTLFVLSGLRLNLSCGFGRWDTCWMTGACRILTLSRAPEMNPWEASCSQRCSVKSHYCTDSDAKRNFCRHGTDKYY